LAKTKTDPRSSRTVSLRQLSFLS